MVIESISIESFGKLNKLELCFHDSFNIIEGENESGKSTVAAFIKYMLYGFSGRASDTTLSDKQRYISWRTSSAEGSMTVRTDSGERYRIMRRTVLTTSSGRDVYRESSSIIDLRDNSVVFPKKNAGEVLLGLPEQLFDNIAFVGQFSDSRTSPDTTEAIENMLFSGDESVNVQKATDKLELARRALLHKNGKGGKIYELTARLDELNARFSEAVKKNEEIFESESILAKTETQIRENDEQTELLCACIKTYDNICTAKEFASLHSKEKQLSDEKEKKAKLLDENTYEGFYPDNEYVTALAVARSRVANAKAACERAKQKELEYRAQGQATDEYTALKKSVDAYGSTEKVLQKADESERDFYSCSKKARTMLCIGIPLCPIIVGIFLVIASLSAKRRASEAQKQLFDIYAEFGVDGMQQLRRVLLDYETQSRSSENASALASAAKKELDEAKYAYCANVSELSCLLAKWGISDDAEKADIDSVSAKVLSIRKEQALIDSEIYRLESELSAEKSKLEGKDEVLIAEEISSQRDSVLELLRTNDISKINDALSFCRDKGRALAQKERDVRERYLSLKASTEDPSEIKEKIYSTEHTLDTLKKQHAAYMLALEAIEGAGQRLRAQMSPRLSGYAQNAISYITSGKYSELGVDSALSLSCLYENEQRTPEEFSAGTRMAIYLSLRLALIDMLCHEKLPLCLDETLVYQDDERAKKLISFLAKESKGKTQCFLFTCHGREALMLDGNDAAVIRM